MARFQANGSIQSPPAGTVTFLFTDIERSTALWEQHPDAMRAALARHDSILRDAIAARGGYIFKTGGDAFCAAFNTAPEAIAAAADAQRALHREPWGTVGLLRVRMAVHTGAAELRGSDYFGPPLNRVARLLGAAHGGQVLVSQVAENLARDQLPQAVSLRDLGEHRLKDLQDSERVFQLVVPELPGTFPALRTSKKRPNNLSLQPTPLIAREQEVRAIRDLLRRPDVRLVTLTGAAGIGKTRLGLQAAAEGLDDFTGGVFVIALATISDPELFPLAIARTLAIRDVSGQPILATLKEYLRDKALLLVLDNFEQLLTAAPIVSELLSASAGLKILVTSQAVLRIRAEYEFSVPALGLPDTERGASLETLTRYGALALFTERAKAIKPDFELTTENAVAVTEVCRRLDGLPLAIELVAARIRLLSPQAMLARLDRRLSLLTGGARDLPVRHQTLRGAISWSYDLLNESEQRLFRRLAVFVGSFTFEATETICSPNGDLGIDLFEGIESLTVKSLLVRIDSSSDIRFKMLQTIREYALEQLQASGETDAMWQRYVDYFVRLGESAAQELRGPGWKEWLIRLETENDNLRAALARSQEDSNEVDVALRLGGTLSWFWYVHGHLAEGRRWLERSLEMSGGSGPYRARALNGAALLAENQGDLEVAEAMLNESLTLSESQRDDAGTAWTLSLLGLVARDRGEFARARKYLEKSLAYWRNLADPWGIRVAMLWLGSVARYEGDTEGASQQLERCLVLCRESGDEILASRARMHLSALAYVRGDHQEAESLANQNLNAWRDIGSPWGVALSLRWLGDIARSREDFERASVLGRESLVLTRDLGDKRGIQLSLLLLMRIAESKGDHERATRLGGAEEALRETMRAPIPPDHRSQYDRDTAAARAGLGAARFASTWVEGRAMSLGQAIAYALEAPAPA